MLQRFLNLRYLGPVAALCAFVGPALSLPSTLAAVPRTQTAVLAMGGTLLMVLAAVVSSAGFYWLLSRSEVGGVPRRVIWVCGLAAAILHLALIALAVSGARGITILVDLLNVPLPLVLLALSFQSPALDRPLKAHPRLPFFACAAAIFWGAYLAFLALKVAAIPFLYPIVHRQYNFLSRPEPANMLWIWLRDDLFPVPSTATAFLAPFCVYLSTRAKHEPEPEA